VVGVAGLNDHRLPRPAVRRHVVMEREHPVTELKIKLGRRAFVLPAKLSLDNRIGQEQVIS
jgi:hypothetical protein